MSKKTNDEQLHEQNGHGELKELSFADIVAVNDREPHRVRVEIPEWGGYVFAEPMSGAARLAVEKAASKREVNTLGEEVNRVDTDVLFRGTISSSIVNAKGERIFFSAEQVEAAMQKSYHALQRMWAAAARLNGLLGPEREALKGNSDRSTGTAAPPV